MLFCKLPQFTAMDPIAKQVKLEFPGLIRVYTDGSVDRLYASPHVPPSPEDPDTGVASKDFTISTGTGLSARLYLPKLTTNNPTHRRLPFLLYFHGGGFCVESAFSLFHHRYMNILASRAPALVISVEYRKAPEHPLPAGYEDCWDAVQWVASHCGPSSGLTHDQWLTSHGDFGAIFIGGDSAGANIAMRAGKECLGHGVKILGAFLSHPFFLDRMGDESLKIAYKIWEFVYPEAPGGSASPMINPMGEGAPSLSKFECDRVLVLVAEKDEVRDIGMRYYEAIRESGYQGKVELYQADGEGHGFHIYNPATENAELMFQRIACFLQN